MAYKKKADLPKSRKTKDPYEGMTVVKIEKKPHGNTGNAYAKGAKGNRLTVYRDTHPKLVRTLMDGGSTQFEVAQMLGVSEQTLYEWAGKYPEFKSALRLGAEAAVSRAELSLFQKAVGYKWVEEVKSKTVNDVGEEVEEVTQITKTLPPDTSSLIFFLKNRKAHAWKDKHEVTMNHNVNVLNSNDLNNLLTQSLIDADYKIIEPNKETPLIK